MYKLVPILPNFTSKPKKFNVHIKKSLIRLPILLIASVIYGFPSYLFWYTWLIKRRYKKWTKGKRNKREILGWSLQFIMYLFRFCFPVFHFTSPLNERVYYFYKYFSFWVTLWHRHRRRQPSLLPIKKNILLYCL